MSPLVLNVSKVLLLVVIYGFLWVVARAVRSHLTPAATVRPEPTFVSPVFVAPMSRAGTTIAVDRPTVVGRGEQADVVIDDPFASDHHARFDRVGGRLLVEDLGSKNGTLVNGAAITERRVLEDGDTIRIGETIMEVR